MVTFELALQRNLGVCGTVMIGEEHVEHPRRADGQAVATAEESGFAGERQMRKTPERCTLRVMQLTRSRHFLVE